MTPHFMGKKVLITGAGKNQSIGQAIAHGFAQAGADIIITYHTNPQDAEIIINEISTIYKKHNISDAKVKAIQVNLEDAHERNNLVSAAYEFLGDIDILVNNAGAVTRKRFLELAEEDIANMFEVNFFAPLSLTQQIAKQMINQQSRLLTEGKSIKDYCIINITSISRTVITQGLSIYEASKAALNHLSKSVARELAQFNIRVNDVAPGLVQTELNRTQWENNPLSWQKRVAGIPLNRTVKHEDIAQAVLFVAANTSMTASTITVDGGRSCNWYGSEINEK